MIAAVLAGVPAPAHPMVPSGGGGISWVSVLVGVAIGIGLTLGAGWVVGRLREAWREGGGYVFAVAAVVGVLGVVGLIAGVVKVDGVNAPKAAPSSSVHPTPARSR